MEIIVGKDPELWKTAKKRATFRKQLYTYLVVYEFSGVFGCSGTDFKKPMDSLSLCGLSWDGELGWPLAILMPIMKIEIRLPSRNMKN